MQSSLWQRAGRPAPRGGAAGAVRPPAPALLAAAPRPWRSARGCRLASCATRAAQRLVLYTKPDCPLCDGLKDKVAALIDRAAFMPSALSDATLEVRDISTNAAWQDEMHLSVPVLAALREDGEEVVLPRPQPRVTADRLERHIAAALEEAGLARGEGD